MPLPRPRSWVNLVNEPQTEAELEVLRRSVVLGRSFGSADWSGGSALVNSFTLDFFENLLRQFGRRLSRRLKMLSDAGKLNAKQKSADDADRTG